MAADPRSWGGAQTSVSISGVGSLLEGDVPVTVASIALTFCMAKTETPPALSVYAPR
ncbi:hypothetical protein M2351_005313 [Azospirillum canadense]|nr:hypothetical protein [Azospirillum canadense]